MILRYSPSAEPLTRLDFTVEAPLVARFFLLLQQGVMIRRRVGCSVDAFLREQLGAGPETIERIQSIMLDGRPVDDIGTAMVLDGSTLALSAALPGLVGATLRRGGTYASLRSGITYRDRVSASAPGTGWVTVKLFNLIMGELGPGLLREGVLVRTTDLLGLLAGLSADAWPGIRRITLDGTAVDCGQLREAVRLRGTDRVLLSVVAEPAGR
jgi:hypothetical protein